MLALKKRKVDDSEQIKKSSDMYYIHPTEHHRDDYMFDKAKENSEMILKSMAIKSLRDTNGYVSIHAKRIKDVETSCSYKKLPRSCYHCSMLQLEPVIQIVDDEMKCSQETSFVKADMDVRKPGSYKGKPKNCAETESSCTITSNQRLLFEDKNLQPLVEDLDDWKQNMHDPVEKSIVHGAFCLSSSNKLAAKDNNNNTKNYPNFKISRDVEESMSVKTRLSTNDSPRDADIKDIEFDSEMDNVLLDIPESSFMEKPRFSDRETSSSKDRTLIEKEQSEFQSLDDTPQKTIMTSSILSSVIGPRSTGIKSDRISQETSYMSSETIQKTKDKSLKQNIPSISRTVAIDYMPKRLREVNFKSQSALRNKGTTIKTPRFRPQPSTPSTPSIDQDLDDDVIITKTVYKGNQVVYRDDPTSKSKRCNEKTIADRRKRDMHFSNLTEPKGSFAENNIVSVNSQFSTTSQKAGCVESSRGKKAEKDARECPICLLRFPNGWTSSHKNAHLSECLTDDMFMDENEDFGTQF